MSQRHVPAVFWASYPAMARIKSRLEKFLIAYGLKKRGTRPYEAQYSEEMDMPPFKGVPRTFLMATTPRCGSHLVGHALWQTGYFGVPLEYLNRGNMPGWHARFRSPTIKGVFRALVKHRTSPSGWFGVKAHWSQYRPYRRHDLFRILGGIERVLFVFRQDLLAQAISYARAEQTGQWITGAPMLQDPFYSYDAIARLATTVTNENSAWVDFFREHPELPVAVCVYEDLLSNQSEMFRSIAHFLDPSCDVAPVATDRTRRQASGESTEWAARFRTEVRASDRWILEPQLVPSLPRIGSELTPRGTRAG